MASPGAPAPTEPRGLSRLFKARIPGRTFFILVPVHLAAFLLLYFGTMILVRNEILFAHSSDAGIVLREAVNDLHPAMECGDSEQVRASLAKIAATHSLVSMELYDSDGIALSDRSTRENKVGDFLERSEDDDFWFDEDGDELRLSGMLRIRSEGVCSDCHTRGETIGAATMSLDLSSQYRVTRKRLRTNLALLISGWAVLIAVVNIGARRLVRLSVEKLRSEIDDPEKGAGGSVSPVARAMLDPMSADLYESLREVLHAQQKRSELLSDKLLHTERLASLGKLAAGLAHEIKNPLAGIQGTLELLRDEIRDDDERVPYDQMLVELKRVNETIHSLLRFARPTPPRRVATDVHALLEETVQLLRSGFAKRRIELEISVAPNVGPFSLDRQQIRQVVLNLVHNAADAIESDGRIAIQVTSLPEAGGLLMAVEDDGPGLEPDEQAKIFEPFHTTKFHGTGLGLAVARSMVSQHGGTIELRSQPGEGTTFLIVLPAKPKDGDNMDSEEA